MTFEIDKQFLDHLSGQFELAHPILFTGAGFSRDATSISGKSVPSVEELKRILWNIRFRGEPYDAAASLADLFDAAAKQHPKELVTELTSVLTIDAAKLPEWYAAIFSVPWAKCYTLNIDDLASAVARRFEIPRRPKPLSALDSANNPGDELEGFRNLLVIHLNGVKDDLPAGVTFSTVQYAERLARQDPWYMALVAELLTRPFVFIGTTLDESPLWQHIELRQQKGGRSLRELRPRSYLVSPTLGRAREALLADHNVVWIPLTGEEFYQKILSQLTPALIKGSALLAEKVAARRRRETNLKEVAALATNPLEKTEYLLGQEPIWADIQSGRAIERESDADLLNEANDQLSIGGPKGIILVSGTAGSGKSTSLMRLSLALSAKGVRVGWIDKTDEVHPREIREAMESATGPSVLAIDDADLYGSELSPMLREIAANERAPLLLIAIRSGRVDKFLNPNVLTGTKISEKTVPNLADNDIRKLLEVLDKENRLGYLKGKLPNEQFGLLQRRCGRQLLVAMIEATSNSRFDDKAIAEYGELSADSKLIYSLVCLSTSFRYGLARDEVVIGLGGNASNLILNEIDNLVRRRLVVRSSFGDMWARHRVIADIVVDELRRSGVLLRVITGLALLAAAKVTPQMKRSARPWRLLRSAINHDMLIRMVGAESARNLYGSLEGILSWDYQFWLQRGSLEVEYEEDLSLGENFLNQALGLGGDDPFVQTEYAYLQFRKAIRDPRSAEAPRLAESASTMLHSLILNRGISDVYPYHVLGSQALAWVRRGLSDPKDKEIYLRRVIGLVQDGVNKHSYNNDIRQLLGDLKKELLSLAVRK